MARTFKVKTINRCLNQIFRIDKSSFATKPPLYPNRIFSGIQPTGNVHLGNYFGAIRRWVDFQKNRRDAIYCVVDLHSITVPQDPIVLQQNILEMTATLLACGIDPDECILFQQSTVRQHSELCWILGTISTMARLSHLPQYKEKSKLFKDIPLGIYVYPVLQAADILLYKATEVPVGEDQIQQIQMAQQLTKTFNFRFGTTFPSPQPLIAEDYAGRLRNLRDPTKKMSKSEADSRSRIHLSDTPDVLLEKFKKAITDFTSEVTYDPENRPGVANLLSIHSMFTGKTPEHICEEYKNLDTGEYKLVLADVVIESLKPIREKLTKYLASPDFLIQVLDKGRDKASEIAENTMLEVKEKIGFNIRKELLKNKIKEPVSNSQRNS